MTGAFKFGVLLYEHQTVLLLQRGTLQHVSGVEFWVLYISLISKLAYINEFVHGISSQMKIIYALATCMLIGSWIRPGNNQRLFSCWDDTFTR